MATTNVYSILSVTFVLAVGIDSANVFISNLNADCLRCLCQSATGCNKHYGCHQGFCGPYFISRAYWVDGGKSVLPQDNAERNGAFESCAQNYACAQKSVRNYMAKYGRDCNGDGVTDCDDYLRIHFNGGNGCESPIGATDYHQRYINCRSHVTTRAKD